MPRCGDCNRFVSLDQGEPEVDMDLSVEGGMVHVQGSVRIFNCCADCSQELTEATEDFDQDVEFEHSQEECEGALTLSGEEAEADDRMEGIGRYAKHFYGAAIRAQITCGHCDGTLAFEEHCEVQAGWMDALN